jgi:hypothetical protein
MISEIERGTKAATVLVLDGVATGLETSLARLDLTLDRVLNTLKVGDSIYYDGDCLHGFANSGRTACAYYLAMDVSGDPAGAQHRITKDADPGDHAGVRRPHANGTTAPGRGEGGGSRVLRKAPRRVPSSRNGGKVHDK